MSISQPLVSVLMTVYNREKYIAKAIESVLNSTYANWELIIVDDRSKDESVTIAQNFAKTDDRIKVYVNKENLGDYPNRNKAASYALGKYLKYVDADDMIYPHGLELLVYYMEQFPNAGYGLCSLAQDKAHIYPFALNPEQAYQRHYVHNIPLFHKAPLSAIINRDAFRKVNGFTGKRMLGDFEMWNLVSRQFDVVLMPQGIVWYREHDEQEMSVYKADPMQPFRYLVLAEELLKDVQCPLNQKEKELAIQTVKRKQSRAILSAAKHHPLAKALEMKKNSQLSLYDIINNVK